MKPRKPSRRGFAMVLVLVFVTMILTVWGVAGRHIASMIRIEQARANRARHDVTKLPALAALARSLAALEAGYPPASPYTCSILGSDGTRFAASFVRDPERPEEWAVSVAPGADDSLPPLDESLFGATPPSTGA
jgi:hypothetical protein